MEKLEQSEKTYMFNVKNILGRQSDGLLDIGWFGESLPVFSGECNCNLK